MSQKISRKSLRTLTEEWDALAAIRFDQISTGEDLTFRHVLVPTMFELIDKQPASKVLDAGCGVGIFTNFLAKKFDAVTGVDPSAKSIEFARTNFGDSARFITSTLEKFARTNRVPFDLITANMVLMDTLNLSNFIKAAHSLLKSNGRFVFSITHPWFWPDYYGYSDEPWFHYNGEIIVEGPFRISSRPDGNLISTHVHRPLQNYFQELENHGFDLEDIREPMPSKRVNRRYPAPWKYPRYLLVRCKKKRARK